MNDERGGEAAERGGGNELGAGEAVYQIPLGRILVNPWQPRRAFDEEKLQELARSVARVGVMQPIVVRPYRGNSETHIEHRLAAMGYGAPPPEGYREGEVGRDFELVAGERRWRAAAIAGLETIPAVVRDVTGRTSAEWALIENLQRVDLGPLEKGEAFKQMVSRFSLTHEQVAERVGMDRTTVTNFVRLTLLEDEIRALLESGALGMGHAKVLLSGAAQGSLRVELAQRAAAEGWSVRALEAAVGRGEARVKAGDPGAVSAGEKKKGPRPDSVSELEKQLGEHLGTKVTVRGARGWNNGRIVIEFYDLDHFDGLMEKIGFEIRE